MIPDHWHPIYDYQISMAFIAEVEFSIDIIIVIKGAEEQIFGIYFFFNKLF